MSSLATAGGSASQFLQISLPVTADYSMICKEGISGKGFGEHDLFPSRSLITYIYRNNINAVVFVPGTVESADCEGIHISYSLHYLSELDLSKYMLSVP